MEVKEVGKRVAITKPIDSKPGFTKFKSLSELLAGANNNVCTQTARVIKPIVNRPSVATLFSQGEASVRTTPMPETKPPVIYKPLAKVVSKATLSFLANMGSHTTTHYQVQSPTQHVNHSTPTSSTKSTSVVVGREVEKVTNPTLEPKPFVASANVDRPSYDGYNWRKYGQKQVKGSDFPRSYYKCTHPNCVVKKKVERSFDGQIAEIVYKGDHNHTKPLPPKNYQDLDNSKSSNNNASQGVFENHGEVVVELPNQTTYLKILQQLSHNRASVSKEIEVDIDEEPKSKRRKSGIQSNNSAMLEEGAIQQPRILVQNATENEILGDGFRWRKYGQKIVKGNTYPRSYYKCTSLKCNVRKHVERASDDPKAFITTYEGKHNHHMPLID